MKLWLTSHNLQSVPFTFVVIWTLRGACPRRASSKTEKLMKWFLLQRLLQAHKPLLVVLNQLSSLQQQNIVFLQHRGIWAGWSAMKKPPFCPLNTFFSGECTCIFYQKPDVDLAPQAVPLPCLGWGSVLFVAFKGIWM